LQNPGQIDRDNINNAGLETSRTIWSKEKFAGCISHSEFSDIRRCFIAINSQLAL
jgi:hypothetical protein